MREALIPCAVFALAIGLAPVVAAQDVAKPSPQPQAQPPASQAATAMSQKSQSLDGELVSVDPVKKLVRVKTAAGQEEKVAFTDETKITGATNDTAGLATASGSRVTIEYTGEGSTRVATKITVQKPKM
jgi:hypothetical protein